jgi:hypothetical protein
MSLLTQPLRNRAGLAVGKQIHHTTALGVVPVEEIKFPKASNVYVSVTVPVESNN